MTASAATVTELIGVYHADGGPVGEAKYVLGKILGAWQQAVRQVCRRFPGLRRLGTDRKADSSPVAGSCSPPCYSRAMSTKRL